MDILLTSPHHVIHHVWSESVSKLVKKGASSVRSPFLAILQHAPFASSSAGTQSQATSHPNTKCAYPALCRLQPDDFYKCTCDRHVIVVVQTLQWLPIVFLVKPKYLPLILRPCTQYEALNLPFLTSVSCHLSLLLF